ncbi:MAG TPA: hypothetical protein VI451_02340 [Anaerolineales bacterium]|nr:hypothetical protein [Anaerolineales bacterium]
MPNITTTTDPNIKKDNLIVIAGTGGFIGGALNGQFYNQGFTNIRAIDKKPPLDWYQQLD